MTDLPTREVTPTTEGEDIRAAIYARTSSPNQKWGYSLSKQTERCVDRCQSLGWEITFIFRDEAESGKDTDRPMFQKMMAMAEAEVFDVIVFWKLDRFSRSLLHAVQLESELRNYDVGLYSITEQIDTTSSAGRFNFRNIASAAEFERDMIKERTNMGLRALASEYRWPNDHAPFGYRKKEDGKLTPHEKDAKHVRGIFNQYLRKQSMPKVAKDLNSRGVTTKSGSSWSGRKVGKILGNEIYKGIYSIADVNEFVEEYQIVVQKKFDCSQIVRNRFQNQSSSSTTMEQDRKSEIVESIVTQYHKFLDME